MYPIFLRYNIMSILFLNILTLLAPTQSANNLFHSFTSIASYRQFICGHMLLSYSVDEHANYDSKRLHLENLYRMVHYCENVTDCRRSQLLEYFGEVFDRKQCHSNPAALCDNCSSTVSRLSALWCLFVTSLCVSSFKLNKI